MPSPLLNRADPAKLPEPLYSDWIRSMKVRGDATFQEVFANHPALYQWYVKRFYAELFQDGLVATVFKELLRLRLSSRHGCRFCNRGNRQDALAAGLSQEQVDAILDEDNEIFGPAERAILKLADRIALTEPMGVLDEELHGELSACFNDAQVLELGMVAAILTGMAKFMFAFDLVEKEDSCPFHPEQQENPNP